MPVKEPLYKDVDYAYSRISGTFVLYKNELVKVVDKYRDKFTLVKGNGEEARAPLEDLVLSPPNLGMVTVDYSTLWVSRLPKRRDYRQGTRASNIQAHVIGGGRLHRRFGTDKDLFTLSKTHKGEFFTLKEAVEKVQDRWDFCPIARDFALSSDAKLFYRNNKQVGSLNKHTLQLKLKPKYQHLAETLEDQVQQ